MNRTEWKKRFLFLILSFLICFFFLKIEIQKPASASNFELKNSLADIFSENEIQNLVIYPAREVDIPEPTPFYEAPVAESNSKNEINKSVCYLTDNDRYIVERIVSGEAGYETMDGKMAVAQCIKDAMLQDNISAVTVQSKYGYAGWKTDLESTYPEDWVEVLEAIERVFDQGENVTDENILWFYAPKYTTSKWHESQKYVGTYGTQRFFAPWN